LLDLVGVADRPGQPLGQLRAEMPALEVFDGDALAEQHEVTWLPGRYRDPRHAALLTA
jgi:hypothetical protein